MSRSIDGTVSTELAALFRPNGSRETQGVWVAVVPQGGPNLQSILEPKILQIRLLQQVAQRSEQVHEFLYEQHTQTHKKKEIKRKQITTPPRKAIGIQARISSSTTLPPGL